MEKQILKDKKLENGKLKLYITVYENDAELSELVITYDVFDGKVHHFETSTKYIA